VNVIKETFIKHTKTALSRHPVRNCILKKGERITGNPVHGEAANDLPPGLVVTNGRVGRVMHHLQQDERLATAEDEASHQPELHRTNN